MFQVLVDINSYHSPLKEEKNIQLSMKNFLLLSIVRHTIPILPSIVYLLQTRKKYFIKNLTSQSRHTKSSSLISTGFFTASFVPSCVFFGSTDSDPAMIFLLYWFFNLSRKQRTSIVLFSRIYSKHFSSSFPRRCCSFLRYFYPCITRKCW